MFFKPEYILILLFTIVVDYYAGILLESTENPSQKKWYLVMSLVANIGVLAFFKYYGRLHDPYFFPYNAFPKTKVWRTDHSSQAARR